MLVCWWKQPLRSLTGIHYGWDLITETATACGLPSKHSDTTHAVDLHLPNQDMNLKKQFTIAFKSEGTLSLTGCKIII